jgi:hypothetical protein
MYFCAQEAGLHDVNQPDMQTVARQRHIDQPVSQFYSNHWHKIVDIYAKVAEL